MKWISAIPVFLLLCLAAACKNGKPTPATDETGPRLIKLPDTLPASSSNRYAPVDISPMDMSYFPVEYPILKMATDSNIKADMRVIYSRPHLNGRRLFHDVVKYDMPWRLGANEATEIDFFHAVSIQGKRISEGRYILYCIPHPDTWTIVLNSNLDSWGLKQDAGKDIARFDIPVTHNNPVLEYFTMVFERAGKGANLVIAWDEVEARLPIHF